MYTGFWTWLSYFISGKKFSTSISLFILIGIWLLSSVILPTVISIGINLSHPIPSGSEILLLQRETVNDAWDLPREDTFQTFFAHHPQWSDYVKKKSSFEWEWYYAFQRVGDLRAEPLTKAYREGRLKRDSLALWMSIFSPPSLLQRLLQSLAKTDLKSAIAYEDKVRLYHTQLQNFYYPRLYKNLDFSLSDLKNIPDFKSML